MSKTVTKTELKDLIDSLWDAVTDSKSAQPDERERERKWLLTCWENLGDVISPADTRVVKMTKAAKSVVPRALRVYNVAGQELDRLRLPIREHIDDDEEGLQHCLEILRKIGIGERGSKV